MAVIADSGGQTVGTANFVQTAAGVRITVSVRNPPPGEHGIHLHDVGWCEGPAFTSAGGHFNPTGAQHGLRNPAGLHAGDPPSLYWVAQDRPLLNAIRHLPPTVT